MTPTAVATRVRPSAHALGQWTRPVVAISLGAASVGSTFVPALDSGELRWLPLILVLPMALWCAWPIHRASLLSIKAGRPTPDVLASVGILAAVAWSAHATASGHSNAHLIPVALATLVAVTSEAVSSRTDVEPYAASPRWLTPLVLSVAVATLVAWWSAGEPSSAALSVLLIAAPGALRLAAPAAHLVAVRRGVEAGIELRGTEVLETSHRVTTIVLDKVGTITTGELTVTGVDPVEPEHLRNLRWFAGALAHRSDHPVAHAIAKLSGRGRVTQLVTHPGDGMSGSVDRHPVRLGRPPWIGIPDRAGLGVETAVEVDGRILGRIRVGDTVRPDAKQHVDRVRSLGLEPVLVSDLPDADTIDLAEHAGVTVSHASCSAGDRARLVEQLQSGGSVVAMVGGTVGNGSAIDAADLAITTLDSPSTHGIGLANLDVKLVHDAIVLARTTFSTAATNRKLAVAGMLAPIPFAAAGLIAPMYAPLFALVCMVGVLVNSSKTARPDGSRR